MDTEETTTGPVAAEPVCYRHSDRVTYLRCSECEKPICPDCSYDSAVGQKCAECSQHTGRGKVVSARNVSQWTPAVTTIIAVTVAAYLAQRANTRFTFDYAHIVDAVSAGEWWRGITAAFLHADTLIHIGFNMYLLYALGPRVERSVGAISFAGLYMASAVFGSVAFQFLGDGAAVGASGAVYGLFGAVLVGTYPLRHTPGGAAQFRQLLTLVGINLVLSFAIPSIAWQAHLGGLVIGAAILFAWQRLPRGNMTPIYRAIVAWGTFVAGVIVLILA